MASVAADPGAIAPPLPLATRSDAAPPAGPSNAFADLLDASAPATGPQPQTASTARSDGGSAGQGGAAAGIGDPSGAAARSGPLNGKDPAKDSNDRTTANNNRDAVGNFGADGTIVTGVPVPAFALAPLPAADQTPTAPSDVRTASADAAPPTGSDGADRSGDRKDASASSDAAPAALVAALPNLIPIAVAAAVPVATPPVSTPPVEGSPPAAAPLSAAVFPASGTGAPAMGVDFASSSASAPQADGTTPPGPTPTVAALDALPLPPQPSIASAAPPADELQTAGPSVLPPVSAGGVSDENARSAPALSSVDTPAAPSGALPPAVALGPPAPPVPAIAPRPEIHVTDQPSGNAGSPREAESIPLPLPAQVAVRFAASVHADDGNASDSGTDILPGFGGGEAGGATATNSGEVGAAIPPSFNPVVPTTMQSASTPPMAPQHATGAPNAVALAGIPIAIIARAEAGEKKFEIRLDPPDLGRIEVRLNVDSSGRATSHLIVDRADTLDLLRRDAPALERALQSAGLTTDEGALQFSLRNQSFAGRDQGAAAAVTPPAPAAAADSDLAPIDTAVRRYGAPLGLGGGVDIRV